MDDEIGEVLGYLDSQNYKMKEGVEDTLRQIYSVENWIYIGADPDTPWRSKVGMTSGQLNTRDSSPHNPEYGLYHAFKVKEGIADKDVRDIEREIHRFLGSRYFRYRHRESNRESEWFGVPPASAVIIVRGLLTDEFNDLLSGHYCDVHEIFFPNEWHNIRLANELAGQNSEGLRRPPYKATNNNAPVCLNPTGCGEVCKCYG